MNPDAMAPHGLALAAYFRGETTAEILVRRDDGVVGSVPASHFFRTPAEFTPIETLALEQVRGQILDVGGGSGLHSLVLQTRGQRVTAIDISPDAVWIMQQRGVKAVSRADVFKYQGGLFDTLLMLGHGIGIVEDLAGLSRFLAHARRLLGSGGQILLDSLDVTRSTDEKNLAYHEANRRIGRYIGEIRFQLEFHGKPGPYCGWLQVDPRTLAEQAAANGWSCATLLQQETGDYLARLTRDPSAG